MQNVHWLASSSLLLALVLASLSKFLFKATDVCRSITVYMRRSSSENFVIYSHINSMWNVQCLNYVFCFRPRLGQTLHKVVGVGGLYFLLASIEGCMRVDGIDVCSFLLYHWYKCLDKAFHSKHCLLIIYASSSKKRTVLSMFFHRIWYHFLAFILSKSTNLIDVI